MVYLIETATTQIEQYLHTPSLLDPLPIYIHVNKHSDRTADDGSCTIGLAHIDPGVANWVETASHERVTMCMRGVGASEHVDPTTQVIKHDQLEKALAGALAA